MASRAFTHGPKGLETELVELCGYLVTNASGAVDMTNTWMAGATITKPAGTGLYRITFTDSFPVGPASGSGGSGYSLRGSHLTLHTDATLGNIVQVQWDQTPQSFVPTGASPTLDFRTYALAAGPVIAAADTTRIIGVAIRVLLKNASVL